MLLYKFVPHPAKGRRVALTPDKTGANLPSDGAPWRLVGSIDVKPGDPPRIALPEEILEAIQESGYLIWPFRKKEDGDG